MNAGNLSDMALQIQLWGVGMLYWRRADAERVDVEMPLVGDAADRGDEPRAPGRGEVPRVLAGGAGRRPDPRGRALLQR